MYERTIQQTLEAMGDESSREVILNWKNLHNEIMSTSFRRAYTSRKFFGQWSWLQRQSPDDVPVVVCWDGVNERHTFWGNPDKPVAYLEELAAYLNLLQKHWRLVLVHDIGGVQSYFVDDPWVPRTLNAVRAVQGVRAKQRMEQREAGERNLLEPQGKPVLLQDFLPFWAS